MERLEAINTLLMIILIAANLEEILVSMESHNKNIDRFVEKHTKPELVEEIEMLKDMVFH